MVKRIEEAVKDLEGYFLLRIQLLGVEDKGGE